MAFSIPAQAVLIFFVRLGTGLGAEPPWMHRSTPAGSRHSVTSNFPNQNLSCCRARDKCTVGRESEPHNWRIHGQEALGFAFGHSSIPDKDRTVVSSSRNQTLVIRSSLVFGQRLPLHRSNGALVRRDGPSMTTLIPQLYQLASLFDILL